MSTYYCSITGEVCEVPVASKKSGHIYEKRIIEKYLDATGICPVTNSNLSKDDLIALKVAVTTTPRPLNGTSFPNLITIFQSEWDSVMLELHDLKKNLESSRQELSHSLYQHDAACRVIARLIKERDEARQQLAELSQNVGKVEEESSNGLPNELIEDILQLKDQLNAQRKERRKNEAAYNNFSNEEDISKFKITASIPLHSTTKPGISALDIHPQNDSIIATGGNDGSIIFFNKKNEKIVGNAEIHTKKVTEVAFVPSSNLGDQQVLLLSSSEDSSGSLLLHNLSKKETSVSYKISNHKAGLTSAIVHPIETVGIFTSRDSNFSIHDLSRGQLLQLAGFEEKVPLISSKIHPDGELVFFGGHDGILRVWSLSEGALKISLNAHQGAIDNICFSDNGTSFATSSQGEGVVKLWDIRKLSEDKYTPVMDKGGAISFDASGRYLAVGTNSLFLYNVKTNEEFAKFTSHKDNITSIRFGSSSKFIASGSLDRYLNIYG